MSGSDLRCEVEKAGFFRHSTGTVDGWVTAGGSQPEFPPVTIADVSWQNYFEFYVYVRTCNSRVGTSRNVGMLLQFEVNN